MLMIIINETGRLESLWKLVKQENTSRVCLWMDGGISLVPPFAVGVVGASRQGRVVCTHPAAPRWAGPLRGGQPLQALRRLCKGAGQGSP